MALTTSRCWEEELVAASTDRSGGSWLPPLKNQQFDKSLLFTWGIVSEEHEKAPEAISIAHKEKTPTWEHGRNVEAEGEHFHPTRPTVLTIHELEESRTCKLHMHQGKA